MKNIVGRKVGMTRVFDPQGSSVPVTVIQVEENRVTQIKCIAKEGHYAVQVTTGKINPKKINRSQRGHFAKAQSIAGRGLWEFRTNGAPKEKLGQKLSVDVLKGIQKVDVTGLSKGKGFAGTIKRWNFKSQDASHGNSLSHRKSGSTGQNQTPGRVFKGKKMAGQMGNSVVTVQNLSVVRIDSENCLLLVRGSVPGTRNGNLIIKPSVK